MKKINSRIFVYLLPVLLFSCRCNDGYTVGGPCTYDTKYYPATIISIINIDSIHADIVFRIEDKQGQLYRDSVLWSQVRNGWALIADVKKDSLAIGQKLKYQINEIKTGTCNPQMERLLSEKY